MEVTGSVRHVTMMRNFCKTDRNGRQLKMKTLNWLKREIAEVCESQGAQRTGMLDALVMGGYPLLAAVPLAIFLMACLFSSQAWLWAWIALAAAITVLTVLGRSFLARYSRS